MLHVATGLPRLMVVTIDTCDGPHAHAGLAFAYHEVVTSDGLRSVPPSGVSSLCSRRSEGGKRVKAPRSSRYAVPFFRYEGSGPSEYPANASFVGRDRERARMLDWLLAVGGRGTYLVTGYRGVGKTNFVDYCVKQYAGDVYGRYLQSRAGRALFWDRFVILFVLVFALLVPLFGAQLFGMVARSTVEGHSTPSQLGRVVVAGPLLLVALFPWLHAWTVTGVAVTT